MNAVAARMMTSLLYLAASCLVFVFGSSYFSLFRTNKSWLFKTALVVIFVPISWLVMRSNLDPAYGLLSVAFLAAAAASLLGAAAGAWLPRHLRLGDSTFRDLALRKGLEALVVVAAVLGTLAIARVPLGDAYLRVGKLWLGLGLGVGGFALFAGLASQQAKSLQVSTGTILKLLPWILLFAFANAFMEELWLRAIFLQPLVSLVGPFVAIPLTAAVFSLAHVGATYMSKEERTRFLIILFPLGLAWGACLHFTGSIIASTLFHAGADLMIVNGFIAGLLKQKAAEE